MVALNNKVFALPPPPGEEDASDLKYLFLTLTSGFKNVFPGKIFFLYWKDIFSNNIHVMINQYMYINIQA